MNFLWCNRCNKKSEDNILNFNSTENFAKNNRQIINNKHIIKKIDSKTQFPNINISENIQSSINNINNLEEEKEDELEIIDYPYSKKDNKILNSKMKPKEFKNNKSKFVSLKSIEQDILFQLNNSDNAQKLKKKSVNPKPDLKKQIGRRNHKDKIKNNEIQKKDTMTDPANIALSSLMQDINKKKSIKLEKNIEKKKKNKNDDEDLITVKADTNNDFFEKKKDGHIKEMKIPNILHKNNLVKKDIENKITNNKITKSKKNLTNKNKIFNDLMNKLPDRKLSQNKKFSEYNNNIIKKKNMLKNKGILTTKINLGSTSLSSSNKNLFSKSNSFNCFNSEKKLNNHHFIKKRINYNDLGHNLTNIKKNENNLFNNIYKNTDGIWSSKKSNKTKRKLKLSHKKVSRPNLPIQKALSSHISSYH